MNVGQAREAVYERFIAIWNPSPSVPVIFENEKGTSEGLIEFVHVFINHVGGGQHTLGAAPNRIFRRQAQLVVVFRVEVDKGMARLDALAQIVRSGLEATDVGGIWYTDADFNDSGNTKDGFRTGTLTVNFTYDEEK